MAATGKTGADAIFFGLKAISHVIIAYNLKLAAVVTAAFNAGAITASQRDSINLFLANANAFALAFEALAAYSGLF